MGTFTTDLLGTDSARLNVGGHIFMLKWTAIEKIADSRLNHILNAKNMEELLTLCDEVDVGKQELYFDRSPKSFLNIIDYYYTNALHLDARVCIISYYHDLLFWGLQNCEFDSCCSYRFHQLKEDIDLHIKNITEIEMRESIVEKVVFKGFANKLREKIWNITENPETSRLAKVFPIISILFVIISTFALVTGTVPDFKTPVNITNTDNVTSTILVDPPVFAIIEYVCIAWFTFEYIIRLFAAPVKRKFLLDSLNIIDLISILPFYFSIAISYMSADIEEQTISIRKLFTLFRVLRILRIFKLARHSRGLKAFGKTIKMSINELGVLSLFMGVAVLLFSSLAYFAEKDEENTMYTSIPAAFWWALITITTVGYGDMYPMTTPGRIVGIFCCIGGILVLSMPIPIIVDNFRKIVTDEQITEKAIQFKLEREFRKSIRKPDRGQRDKSQLLLPVKRI